jgi:hypothetical protein
MTMTRDLSTCKSKRTLIQLLTVNILDLHQHQSSRNLHLQYLAKSQSTQLSGTATRVP